MMSIDPRGLLPLFHKLADEASERIMMVYGTAFSAQMKDDGSPVTQADRLANDHIVQGLQQAFPDIPVLAEESEDSLSRLGARHLFLVDPLDGTKEFVKKNDEFTVNIALLEDGQPVVGLVRSPVTGEVWYASKGNGTWHELMGVRERITVSNRTSDIRLMASRSHGTGQVEALIRENHIQNVLVAGSSLKGCRIAEGKAEAYYRFGRTMEWDTAAMQIVLEEAGGIMCMLDGSPMVYNKQTPEHTGGFFMLNHWNSRLKLPVY